MRNPRLHALLLVAAVGLGVWPGWPATKETTSRATHTAVATQSACAPATAARVVEFLSPETPRAHAIRPATTLAPDDEALMTETSALQLLAADTDLELAARQWSALATATLKIQAIRHAYEASIARAASIAPGRYRVEIPAYAAAGDALREKLHGELRAQLGEANAAEVLAQLGARLEAHFAGFGVSVQTLDIAGADADCVVTRTVQYWNSVEGRDRLSTRRETSFPAREDPTGETWRPLLALVGARG